MSEERLQEIKDSVEFQKEILKAHNMDTLCVDEEQELVEEIERLNNIINNTAVELEILLQSENFELITMQLRNIVFRLKGEDKE